jgi:hypothetical protein
MTILKSTATALATVSIFVCAQAAYAGDTCAYITGTVEGSAVATPAVLVITPTVSVVTTPARVIVDETTQSIVGYQLNTPLVDGTVPGDGVFVPAHQAGIGAHVATLDDLELGVFRCINLGVTTPAVPIFVPPSFLEVPGVTSTTPGTTITISQKQVTVPAVTVAIPGRDVVVPGIDQTVPPLQVETPEQSIIINHAVAVGFTYLPPVAVVDGGGTIDNLP